MVKNGLFLRLGHGSIDCHGFFILNQCKSESKRYIAKVHSLLRYAAASSIFSINIPYPRVGSFTNTWVTAPTSFPS